MRQTSRQGRAIDRKRDGPIGGSAGTGRSPSGRVGDRAEIDPEHRGADAPGRDGQRHRRRGPAPQARGHPTASCPSGSPRSWPGHPQGEARRPPPSCCRSLPRRSPPASTARRSRPRAGQGAVSARRHDPRAARACPPIGSAAGSWRCVSCAPTGAHRGHHPPGGGDGRAAGPRAPRRRREAWKADAAPRWEREARATRRKVVYGAFLLDAGETRRGMGDHQSEADRCQAPRRATCGCGTWRRAPRPDSATCDRPAGSSRRSRRCRPGFPGLDELDRATAGPESPASCGSARTSQRRIPAACIGQKVLRSYWAMTSSE